MLWNTLLLAHERFLPDYPGKWRAFERVLDKARRAWKDPCVVRRRGIVYELDRRRAPMEIHIYYDRFEVAETKFIGRCVKPGWTVIDVGANLGHYTLVLSKLVGPQGRVYAFEPSTLNHKMLRRNIDLNGAANVRAFQLALGAREGVVPLIQSPKGHHELTRVTTVGEATEYAPVTTLDRFASEHDLPSVDLIKMDIEGSELFFLQGAAGVLERCAPILLFELHPLLLSAFGAHPSDVANILQRYGYSLFIPRRRGLDLLSELPRSGDIHVVAVAPGRSELEAIRPTLLGRLLTACRIWKPPGSSQKGSRPVMTDNDQNRVEV
jgi:FkbM family methyltransferase